MKQSRVEREHGNEPSTEPIARSQFPIVVESHRSQVFRFLLASSRDIDTAETLTQECFLRAYRNWPKFCGDSSPQTWLIRIAINLQKDYWRNRRLQFWRHTRANSLKLSEASEWLPDGGSSPEQRVLANEQVGQVWRAVKRMSERRRTVFLRRFVEEMELNEIANATGLHEGTVRTHLSRAVTSVRAELGREKQRQQERIKC